jgi:hypothetical protein
VHSNASSTCVVFFFWVAPGFTGCFFLLTGAFRSILYLDRIPHFFIGRDSFTEHGNSKPQIAIDIIINPDLPLNLNGAVHHRGSEYTEIFIIEQNLLLAF